MIPAIYVCVCVCVCVCECVCCVCVCVCMCVCVCVCVCVVFYCMLMKLLYYVKFVTKHVLFKMPIFGNNQRVLRSFVTALIQTVCYGPYSDLLLQAHCIGY